MDLKEYLKSNIPTEVLETLGDFDADELKKILIKYSEAKPVFNNDDLIIGDVDYSIDVKKMNKKEKKK